MIKLDIMKGLEGTSDINNLEVLLSYLKVLMSCDKQKEGYISDLNTLTTYTETTDFEQIQNKIMTFCSNYDQIKHLEYIILILSEIENRYNVLI